ncbi:MAG: SDR family NAD(P)-dependent oxidoreductase [Luteimonas sp.]
MATPNLQSLSRAVAIVTGASSGIGFAVARRLAADGAAVVVNFHSRPAPAYALVNEICRSGGRAIAVGADVSDEADVTRVFAETIDAFGRIDVLVANSGVQKDSPVADMTLDDWRAVIDLDLTGQFLCCREAIRHFRKQDASGRPFRAAGAIVSMSSVHDVIPWAGHVNYAASKGGASMMMRTIAQEVAGDRIRVNAVSPGAIRTPQSGGVGQRCRAPTVASRHSLRPYRRAGRRRCHRFVAGIGCGRLRDRHDALRGWRHDALPGVSQPWLKNRIQCRAAPSANTA